MSFNISLHIPDDSPEARILESLIANEDIGANDPVLGLIRKCGPESNRNHILEGRDLFGGSEDAQTLDEAIRLAYEERCRPSKDGVEL